jgi:hypothetical protein
MMIWDEQEAVLVDQLLHPPVCRAIDSSHFVSVAWVWVVELVTVTPQWLLYLQLLLVFGLLVACF